MTRRVVAGSIGCGIGTLMIVVVGLSARSPDATAPMEYRPALAALARDVKAALDRIGQDRITFGQFSGPPTTNLGSGITKHLERELDRLGLKTDPTAGVTITGEYTPRRYEKDGRTYFKIDLALRVYRTEDEEQSLEGTFPRSFLYDPGRGELPRDRQSLRCQADPSLGFQVVVDDKPRTISKERSGLFFVGLKKGEHYAVRLVNDSQRDVLAALSIDGLGMFDLADDKYKSGPNQGWPVYENVMVPPGRTFTIVGWYHNAKSTSKFLVTDIGNGAFNQLGEETAAKADVGLISVKFLEVVPQTATTTQTPQVVSARTSTTTTTTTTTDVESPRSLLATGRGEETKQKGRMIHLAPGKTIGVVSLRYVR